MVICTTKPTKPVVLNMYRTVALDVAVLPPFHSRIAMSPSFSSMRIYCSLQVHVLPREMLGLSTFGIAMALLKWLPVRLVDRILLAAAHLALGNTGQLGLRRPKTGPIELKNLTGRTPVLDVGTLDYIKTGKIKVSARAFNPAFLFHERSTVCERNYTHTRAAVKPWKSEPCLVRRRLIWRARSQNFKARPELLYLLLKTKPPSSVIVTTW
jgi:hypothetical protein